MAADRVLIVEADHAIAEVVTLVLQDEGYAVDRVAATPEARRLIARSRRNAYLLVLSNTFADPRADPYAWLDALRDLTASPIAICSCYPANLYADYRERGFDAYLEEPFDLNDLLNLVAAYSRDRGAQRHAFDMVAP